MAKTWNVTMEGEDLGSSDDINLTFIDSKEIIGKAPLNKRFIDDLRWNIEKHPHYKAIRNIKSIESSTGDKPATNTVGVILASAASDDLQFGFLFTEIKKDSYEIIALWPDDFARVCKAKKELYKKFIVNLVQNPTTFAEVSVVLSV
ncbi:MAG: hypothetical protein HWN66_11090 [Candidatus Helarchaeota archaeon]|nr:hypothetical protein [Candidatus Helarchaeota archaeon]